MGYVPGATFDPTVIVIVDVPAPPAIDAGLKLTVTPVGCPVADKRIVEPNEGATAVAMVDVPLLPCATETGLGEADIVKSPDVDGNNRSLISPA